MESSSSAPADKPVIDEKEVKAEYKKQSFDREFRLLVKQAHETINARYGASMEYGEIRREAVCLNRYLSIYNSMDPTEHYTYFETLFNRKRADILNSLEDDAWIKHGKIVIQFGEGIKSSKEIEEKRKQVRIMLSDIYLIACDLKDKEEKTLDGIDESFAQNAGGKDLIRPSILLLHLMRIFYHLNDGSVKEQLGAIVTQLENDLNVSKKTVQEEKRATAPAQPDSASSLFNMATGMMERFGLKPPPGIKAPSDADIKNAISNVFNNETTQNVIQGIVTTLQGNGDIGTTIQDVLKTVTDPKTMEAFQGTVQGLQGIPGLTSATTATTPSSSSSSSSSSASSVVRPEPLVTPVIVDTKPADLVDLSQ
jgi:hypothetical protein